MISLRDSAVSPEAACAELLATLRRHRSKANVAGMARYGIATDSALGVSMPVVRGAARDAKKHLGRDLPARHALAALLWDTGVHEARIAAALVDVPALVTKRQLAAWVKDFDAWDVCDQVVMNLFDKTPFAWDTAVAWSARRELFVKRAGFALMASLAVHDKGAADARFAPFFAAIEREAADERNFVKKAVSWALRQMGKRSPALRKQAVACAQRLLEIHADSTTARWIARDALRELSTRRGG